MAIPDSYLRTVRNVSAVLEAIKAAGVPDRFNNEFLKQLGFTSSNDRSFVPVFKALRLLDDNSVPTDRYHRFRDSASSRAVMAEALRDAYADLFTIKQSAQTMGQQDLLGAFKRLTGKGEAVAEKMASTFKAFAAHADWTAQGAAAASTGGPEKELAVPESVEPVPQPSVSPGAGMPVMPSLHHDVHIHLPVSSDVKVYDAIFRSLREHFG